MMNVNVDTFERRESRWRFLLKISQKNDFLIIIIMQYHILSAHIQFNILQDWMSHTIRVQLAIIAMCARDNGSFFDSNAVKITRCLRTTTMLNNVIRLLSAKVQAGDAPPFSRPFRARDVSGDQYRGEGKGETRDTAPSLLLNESNYFSWISTRP